MTRTRLLSAMAWFAIACQPAPPAPPASPATGDGSAASSPPVAPSASAPAATDPERVPAAWPWPPAPYIRLFEEGHVFSYRVESASSHYDPDDPKAGKDGNVKTRAEQTIRCVVTKVRRHPRAFEAELSCTPSDSLVFAMDDATPHGVYVATETGIWKMSGFDGDPGALAPKEMLLAAAPTEIDDERSGPAAGLPPDFGEAHRVHRDKAGAWCASRVDWGGDEAWSEVCFAEAEGLVGGNVGWAGGSSHEATFILVK